MYPYVYVFLQLVFVESFCTAYAVSSGSAEEIHDTDEVLDDERNL